MEQSLTLPFQPVYQVIRASKNWLDKYLLYSTIFSIFTEAFFVRYIVDVKLHYFILLVNLMILSTIQKPKYSKKAFMIIGIIAGLGLFSVFNNTNKLPDLFFQLSGIFISSLYYFNFFKHTKYTIPEIFETYCKLCFLISIIGILQIIYYFSKGIFYYRLDSIMLESAHFAAIVLPAFFYFLKNIRKNIAQFIIVFTALSLTVSTVGYVGMLLCLILARRKINILVNLLLFTGAIAVGILLYFNVEQVRLRVDDTFTASNNLDVTDVNLSSYALISNYFVSSQVFIRNPFFGFGLGSHKYSHEQYIENLKGADTFETTYAYDLRHLNSEDANSLFLRVVSDMGLFGLMIIFIFIWRGNSNVHGKYIISRGIIVYFFYKLLREGHYFSPEMYFFVCLYYFNKNREKIKVHKRIKSGYSSASLVAG